MGSVGGGGGVSVSTTTKVHAERSSPQWPLVGVCLGGPVGEAADSDYLGVMLQPSSKRSLGGTTTPVRVLNPAPVFRLC